MTDCTPRTVDLCRSCRLHVDWPVSGVSGGDTVTAVLDTGQEVGLAIAADLRTVTGYFAGPDYATPGAATRVSSTTYVVVKIVTATETLRFPGGFIRLT